MSHLGGNVYHAVRTEDVSPAERFDFWLETLAHAAMPVTLRSRHSNNFVATAEIATVGSVASLAITQPATDLERTHALIRRADPETHHLVLNLSGNQRLIQERREVVLRPGEMTIYSSSRPLWTKSSVRRGHEHAIVLAMPSEVLPLRPQALRDLLAVQLSKPDGISPLASSYLRALAAGAIDRGHRQAMGVPER